MLKHIKYFLKAFIVVMLFYIILYFGIGNHSLEESLKLFFDRNALTTFITIVCIILLELVFIKKSK